jgi:hypothetical protein
MSMNTMTTSQIHMNHKKNSRMDQKIFSSGYEVDPAASGIVSPFLDSRSLGHVGRE